MYCNTAKLILKLLIVNQNQQWVDVHTELKDFAADNKNFLSITITADKWV